MRLVAGLCGPANGVSVVGVAELLSTLLSALLATNSAGAISNVVEKTTGISVNVAQVNDPVEREYLKLLEMDDAAQAEVDRWIKENNEFQQQAAGVERITLNARIEKRFAPVRKAYEEFLQRNPNHAKARLAYGSFLNDIQEEEAAHLQWEKAREADPGNPAAWNNLANYYGHNGPVTNSFRYYAKAIELDPTQSTYYFNLATTVYLFRRDATNFYQISEEQVFEKAMALYRKALELDSDFLPSRINLGRAYEQLGMFDEAGSEFTKARQITAESIDALAALGHMYAKTARASESLAVLDQLSDLSTQRYVSPYNVALIHAALGQIDQAFRWLENAHDQCVEWMIYTNVDPRLDPLRKDPRFSALLTRLGFASAI